MHTIDWVVLVLYFVGMAIIGFLCMRKVQKQEDYFLGGRTFGKIFQTFAAFGAGTGANDPVSVGSSTYKSGFSGIWTVLFWLLVTPFYWIFAVWFRRMRHLTTGDWFVERYQSKSLGAAYAIFGITFYMLYLSVAFSAVGKVCEPLIQGDVGENAEYWLLPLIGLVVIVYGVLGGLRAAYWTDLIQGVFIILLSVILIPYGLDLLVEKFGSPETEGTLDGFRHLHEQVPAAFFSLTGGQFPAYYVVCIFLLNLVGIVVQPHFIATGGGSAKNETAARVGLVVGNFLKRFCTVGWALTGVIMLALLSVYPEIGKDPDQVWGHAALTILEPLGIGLVGLMLACLLAALMSSADCYMLVGSALVVRNCYAAYVKPDATEREYVFVGRIVGVLIISGAVIFSLLQYDVIKQLKQAWEIPVVFAAPFWFGMFWRRSTKWAAWLTVIFSAVVFFVIPMTLPTLLPSLKENSRFTRANHFITVTTQREVSPADVARRRVEITGWDESKVEIDKMDAGEKKSAALEDLGKRPESLTLGATFQPAPNKSGGKGIFWTGGVKPRDPSNKRKVQVSRLETEDGTVTLVERYADDVELVGSGFFSLDFILYEALGVDLESLPSPAIEALRLPPRVFVPLLVMFLLSLITPRVGKESLDRFYVKMKTPTLTDPEADREELEKSYAEPTRFDEKRLFPGTNLEFQKPTRVDIIGFLLSCLGVLGVIALAVWVASIGG
jgi:SSS family solute:Na+ symporter